MRDLLDWDAVYSADPVKILMPLPLFPGKKLWSVAQSKNEKETLSGEPTRQQE